MDHVARPTLDKTAGTPVLLYRVYNIIRYGTESKLGDFIYM